MDFWVIWDMIPRRVRQVVLLIIGIVALVGLPWVGLIAGIDCEQWNIEGLSQSQSITPEMAREMTWNWSSIFFVTGLIFGIILFVIGIVYFFTPEKKKSVWR